MRNWYYFNWLSGDHIVEQHIHNLDVINWIKGDFPIRAQGMGGREVRKGKDHGEIFDHHFVEFEYADGSFLYSQCRHIPGTWSDVSESVQGTKGRMTRIERGIIEGENPWRHIRDGDPNPYRQEHVNLLEAILNNTPFNEAVFGAKSSMTSILGRLCTYSGQRIDWDTAINSEIDLMPKSFAFDAEPPVLPDVNGFYPVAVPGKTITV
jgi:myo-inositol 2-dehydrogenase / D-chiro-inositol 1-dehydrogenase